MAVIRCLVDDVPAAIAFYTDQLGFTLEQIVLDDSSGNPVELFQPGAP